MSVATLNFRPRAPDPNLCGWWCCVRLRWPRRQSSLGRASENNLRESNLCTPSSLRGTYIHYRCAFLLDSQESPGPPGKKGLEVTPHNREAGNATRNLAPETASLKLCMQRKGRRFRSRVGGYILRFRIWNGAARLLYVVGLPDGFALRCQER